MAKKKKNWYEIVSPKVFGSNKVGETMGYDAKSITGRVIQVNARDLTNDFKKSHINIKLIIEEVKGSQAFTGIYRYLVQRQYIQRFLHKNMDKIEVIADLTTKDSRKIRIKMLITLPNKVQTTKKKLLRAKTMNELTDMIKEIEFDNLILMTTTNKLQLSLAGKLQSIHPTKFVEVKRIDLKK